MLSRISAGGDFNFGFHLEMIHQRARWEVPCRLIPRLMLAHAPSAEVGWPNHVSAKLDQESMQKLTGTELDQGEFSGIFKEHPEKGARCAPDQVIHVVMGPYKWPKMKR